MKLLIAEMMMADKSVYAPYIYSIPKGTFIPSHLTLINESSSRFSLQPSRGMPLRDLNQALDEFYDTRAMRYTVDRWVEKYPVHSAVTDDADDRWMST
ncbi:hypothetical protein GGS23DRAFT_576950 [Durotheca rogersii]|uniref:uncharacterized protein n=1 Tax=Durotheca rogersii TaxID=419775 RepID=UPI00222050E5|nr:uncharacterized protein GGS23DRAFT_576950 [Durotheca rogersii]KAI5861474.1 hypothetical protein GGS23DRAFT_576950 [Durotheca rogersii]